MSRRGVCLSQIIKQGSQEPDIRLAWVPRAAQAEAKSFQPDPKMAESVRAAMKAGGFQGDRAVACLSADKTMYRRVTLASPPGSDTRVLVQSHIAEEWGVSSSSICMDYFHIPQPKTAAPAPLDCIAIVAQPAEVESRVVLLSQAGLAPVAMDTTAGAVARCLSDKNDQDRGDCFLVLEIVPDARTLVVARHGVPVFACSAHDDRFKRLAEGGGDNENAGADKPSVDARAGMHGVAGEPVSDLANVVNSLLQYIMDARLMHLLPRRGVIVGVTDRDNSLLQRLTDETTVGFVPLEAALNPLVKSCLKKGSRAPIGDLVVSVGLALYGHEHLASEKAA